MLKIQDTVSMHNGRIVLSHKLQVSLFFFLLCSFIGGRLGAVT